MKCSQISLGALAFALVSAMLDPAVVSAQNQLPRAAAPQVQLQTPRDQASYGIGLSIGRSLQRDGLELNVGALTLGLRDAVSGAKPRLSEEQLRAAMAEFQKAVQAKMQERLTTAGAKNLRDGQAFLEKNKTQPGVQTLPSGLQYQVIRPGNGPTPQATDTVTTNYRGTLIDGTEFDSSYKRGQPASFPVKGVIPGWTEALQRMKVGDKWRLFVPAELAYGKHGSPPVIGPNAVLVFDIELLGIK